MIQRDHLGMEIILKDPIGSTPDLNTLICSLRVDNIRHLRFHLCLRDAQTVKRHAMGCDIKLSPHPLTPCRYTS